MLIINFTIDYDKLEKHHLISNKKSLSAITAQGF